MPISYDMHVNELPKVYEGMSLISIEGRTIDRTLNQSVECHIIYMLILGQRPSNKLNTVRERPVERKMLFTY